MSMNVSHDFPKIVDDFKKLVLQGDEEKAEKILGEIKAMMLELDSLPPLSIETENAASERKFAREALEYAVILSVNMCDKDSFERHITCLRPYYASFDKSQSPASDIEMTVIGLNLLYLLVENRLADFHCELELLSETQHAHPAVTFCTQLDQHLVVGSYDQVLVAAASPPISYYSFFLKSLLETVRENIGECVSTAYQTLTVKQATNMLMFSNKEETMDFITEHYPSWTVRGDTVNLIRGQQDKSDEIPSLKIISQNIGYATELERIV